MLSRTAMIRGTMIVLLSSCKSSGVDTAKESEALLAVDRAWEQVASQGKDVDSVLSFWTDDARVARPGMPPLEGKAAIREMVTSSLTTPGFHITWHAESAVVSKSGDLGYTLGTNEVTIPDSTGKTTKIPGRYLAVWRKGSDGRWRCVLDYTTAS